MAESEVKLTVGEEKVKAEDITKGHVIDMLHRDPEHLHDRIKVRIQLRAYTLYKQFLFSLHFDVHVCKCVSGTCTCSCSAVHRCGKNACINIFPNKSLKASFNKLYEIFLRTGEVVLGY